MAFIVQTLTKYPTLRASRLHQMVRERGYPGAPDHFRTIVAQLRPRRATEAYLRLRTLPGDQAQCDWAHFSTLTVGRAVRPLMAFVMVLSYSRQVFLRFYLGAAMNYFIRGHVEAFTAFQAVPRVLHYDYVTGNIIDNPTYNAAEGRKGVPKAFSWQARKNSMVCDTVNSRYMRRLWPSTIRKKLSRRRVDPTAMVPYSPQSACATSPGSKWSLRKAGGRAARADPLHVALDHRAAPLVAGLLQSLVDLLGAVGVGIEPTHDLPLEGIKFADPHHTLARMKLLHVGPFGHRANIQAQGAGGLGLGELLASQVVANLAEGFIVEHGGAPVRAVGPGSPGPRLSGVAVVAVLVGVVHGAPPEPGSVKAPGTAEAGGPGDQGL